MPIDVSKLLDTNVRTQGKTWDGKATYISDSKGSGANLLALLNAKFPDYMRSTNAKLTPREPEGRGTLAETGGLRGSEVALGKLLEQTVSYSGIGTTGNYKGPDSDRLIDTLGTSLHEIMHTRQQKSEKGILKKQLGNDWSAMLEDAKTSGFPSIGNSSFGGDRLEEFLATAVSVKDMQARDINPKGVLSEAAKALPALEKKYEWLPDYIAAQSMPEIPSLKSWEPSISDELITSLKGMFR